MRQAQAGSGEAGRIRAGRNVARRNGAGSTRGGSTQGVVGRGEISRGPISIFGPIPRVKDRAQDRDLRRAGRNWRGYLARREVGRRRRKGRYFAFFWPKRSKIEGGFSFFWPRRSTMMRKYSFFGAGRSKDSLIFEDCPLRIFEEVALSPSCLPSDLRIDFRSRRSKMRKRSSIFEAEDRRFKMEWFFVLRIQRPTVEGFFVLQCRKSNTRGFFEDGKIIRRRANSSKMQELFGDARVLRRGRGGSSISQVQRKNEDGLPIFDRRIEEWVDDFHRPREKRNGTPVSLDAMRKPAPAPKPSPASTPSCTR